MTCAEASDCEDGDDCTTDRCEADECAATPIPGCLVCGQDGGCDTGCQLGPDTCVAGACRPASGCPDVRVDATAAHGPAGTLVVEALLAESEATRPLKVKARLRLATAEGSERRCRAGKLAAPPARGRMVPGAPLVLDVGLNRRAQRCLEAAGGAGLPVEVTVVVRRARRLVLRRTEMHLWPGA